MIKRRPTRIVNVSNVAIGSSEPIVIQSMTKLATTDVEGCLEQIGQLSEAGCSLVRLAVPTRKDTEAFGRIVQKSPVPLVADVHFSPQRALEAIEAGAAKIRLNPGNIKEKKDIHRIIDSAKSNKTAIRVGVNEASIRDLKNDIPEQMRIEHMVGELKKYVKLFEDKGFDQLVLSAKSSDPVRTIEVNRKIAGTFDYPIHLGLTHAGLPEDARVPSAVTLGALISEGIGDTVRVSAAGDPVIEPLIAKEILTALGLEQRTGPELIVCPTCGRTQIDVVRLAKNVKTAITDIKKPVRIAVMGCVVNGPGEAKDADIAVCAGKGKGFIYKQGQKIATVPENKLIDQLLIEVENF